MADLLKHRDELETFSVTFALDTGELLTGTPTVAVARRHATIAEQWDDVTGEFSPTAIARDGTNTKVIFTLAIRTGTGQVPSPDDHALRVKCSTDGGREPVEAPSLEVLATASV